MSYGSRAFGWVGIGGGQAYGGAGSQNVAPSTTVAVLTTTTRAEIRDSLVSAIIAASPDMLASKGWRYSRHETADFRTWAQDNDAAVFREFVLEWEPWEPFGVSDGLVQRRQGGFSVVVAYPHHWAIYQREGDARRSMEDLIERDMTIIADAVGIHGSANYPSGACPKLDQQVSIEIGEGVSFGVLEVALEWYARI
jgi:hypothetical protein